GRHLAAQRLDDRQPAADRSMVRDRNQPGPEEPGTQPRSALGRRRRGWQNAVTIEFPVVYVVRRRRLHLGAIPQRAVFGLGGIDGRGGARLLQSRQERGQLAEQRSFLLQPQRSGTGAPRAGERMAPRFHERFLLEPEYAREL